MRRIFELMLILPMAFVVIVLAVVLFKLFLGLIQIVESIIHALIQYFTSGIAVDLASIVSGPMHGFAVLIAVGLAILFFVIKQNNMGGSRDNFVRGRRLDRSGRTHRRSVGSSSERDNQPSIPRPSTRSNRRSSH